MFHNQWFLVSTIRSITKPKNLNKITKHSKTERSSKNISQENHGFCKSKQTLNQFYSYFSKPFLLKQEFSSRQHQLSRDERENSQHKKGLIKRNVWLSSRPGLISAITRLRPHFSFEFLELYNLSVRHFFDRELFSLPIIFSRHTVGNTKKD